VAQRANGRRVVVISPVVPYPPLGGGHKRTLRLIEAIERAGGSPLILTPDSGQPGGADALRERGWGVELLTEPPGTLTGRARQHLGRLPSPYVPEIARRVGELASDGCAFVQVEHTQSAYYDRAFAGVPWVLSLHNVDSDLLRSVARGSRPLSRTWLASWNRSLALRSVERRAVPGADAVLCVSEEDRAELAGLGAAPMVVPNGVDDSFFGVPAGQPPGERILFFGQFDYEPNARGIARFLREGWARVASRRPEARLVLAGRGLPAPLRELAARSERVEALGFVDSVEHELAASRLSLAPLWEGGGTRLKVLESLAAARPVVGTALGVAGLGFAHDRHGLVAAGPGEQADAVVALLENAERAERLGAEGRTLAEGFRWSVALRPALGLYERLLQNA
jgi:glycosyltransferase involved in cell wall biosynthesis